MLFVTGSLTPKGEARSQAAQVLDGVEDVAQIDEHEMISAGPACDPIGIFHRPIEALYQHGYGVSQPSIVQLHRTRFVKPTCLLGLCACLLDEQCAPGEKPALKQAARGLWTPASAKPHDAAVSPLGGEEE